MRKEKHLCGKGEWGMPPVSQAFHIVIWAPWDHMVVVAQQARSLKSWLKLTLKLTQSQRCQTHSETGCKKRRILLSKYVWPLTPSIQPLNPFLWMQAFFSLLFCLFFFFWERHGERWLWLLEGYEHWGGEGFHYTYMNNLTALSAHEEQAWQQHNDRIFSPPPTRLALLSKQHG